jgi:predicted nuclease of predicted toxin-antitoxin system
MTILVDVNLSGLWVPYLQQRGIHSVYWTEVGRMDAADAEIFGVCRGSSLCCDDA